MMKTDPLKPKEKPFEFVLPGKNSFNSPKALLKDGFVVDSLPPTLCLFSVSWIFFDVGDHPRIVNHFPVLLGIIGSIKTCNDSFEGDA